MSRIPFVIDLPDPPSDEELKDLASELRALASNGDVTDMQYVLRWVATALEGNRGWRLAKKRKQGGASVPVGRSISIGKRYDELEEKGIERKKIIFLLQNEFPQKNKKIAGRSTIELEITKYKETKLLLYDE